MKNAVLWNVTLWFVRTAVAEEHIASTITVDRTSELGTLAVISN
jgi:hypothetical protein